MLKIISLVVSFFLGRYDQTFKKSTLILIDQFITKSRKLFIFTTVLGVSSMLLVAGLLTAIFQSTSQYDRQGFITFNSTILAGLILIAIASIALITMFSAKTWESRFKQQMVPPPHHAKNETHGPREPNAFEQAITMLVTEFVKDRDLQRQTRQTSPNTGAPSASAFRPTSESTYANSMAKSTNVQSDPIRTHNPAHEVMN